MGVENHSQVFIAVSKGALPPQQCFRIRIVHARRLGQLIDGDLVLGEPLRVRLRATKLLLDLLVGNNAAFDGIDQEHLAGLQAAFLLHLLGGNVEYAGFRSHDHKIVVRDHVATGRSPLRSRVAPITRPSVKAIAAGPSHGSMRQA